MSQHRHEFTALWAHFGPYGPQDVHFHPCFTEGCDRVLLGHDRDCKGPGSKQYHRRMTLRSETEEPAE